MTVAARAISRDAKYTGCFLLGNVDVASNWFNGIASISESDCQGRSTTFGTSTDVDFIDNTSRFIVASKQVQLTFGQIVFGHVNFRAFDNFGYFDGR